MSFVDAQPYIFCHLEGTGYLDINDELHMFAIEYVYFPRMNKHLFVGIIPPYVLKAICHQTSYGYVESPCVKTMKLW